MILVVFFYNVLLINVFTISYYSTSLTASITRRLDFTILYVLVLDLETMLNCV